MYVMAVRQRCRTTKSVIGEGIQPLQFEMATSIRDVEKDVQAAAECKIWLLGNAVIQRQAQ